MDIKKVYNQLTDVNISEQKQFWDERGKGYYGEFLLFSKLYEIIPGCCKILMNLNIPTPNGKTTEIDLLLIHENGAKSPDFQMIFTYERNKDYEICMPGLRICSRRRFSSRNVPSVQGTRF